MLNNCPGVRSIRTKSSASAWNAKLRTCSFAAHGFTVYEPCATMRPIPASAASSANALTSASSIAFAFPPRGFRVKNANVLASMEAAVFAIAAYPLAEER